MDLVTQGLSEVGIQEFMESGIQGFGDLGIQGLGDLLNYGFRDKGILKDLKGFEGILEILRDLREFKRN